MAGCRVSYDELMHDRDSRELTIHQLQSIATNPDLLVDVYETGLPAHTAQALSLVLNVTDNASLLQAVVSDIDDYLLLTRDYDQWIP